MFPNPLATDIQNLDSRYMSVGQPDYALVARMPSYMLLLRTFVLVCVGGMISGSVVGQDG